MSAKMQQAAVKRCWSPIDELHNSCISCFSLLSQVNKVPALTKAQVIKFANYFMSRKSVHQVVFEVPNNFEDLPISLMIASSTGCLNKIFFTVDKNVF